MPWKTEIAGFTFINDGVLALPEDYPDMDLKKARHRLRTSMAHGSQCPACRQPVQFSDRVLYKRMARFLVWLEAERRRGMEWSHVDYYRSGLPGGDYAKLKLWGLIEGNADANGEWRIASVGTHFISEETTISRVLKVYDKVAEGFSDEQIGIREVLGNQIDLNEMIDHFQSQPRRRKKDDG